MLGPHGYCLHLPSIQGIQGLQSWVASATEAAAARDEGGLPQTTPSSLQAKSRSLFLSVSLQALFPTTTTASEPCPDIQADPQGGRKEKQGWEGHAGTGGPWGELMQEVRGGGLVPTLSEASTAALQEPYAGGRREPHNQGGLCLLRAEGRKPSSAGSMAGCQGHMVSVTLCQQRARAGWPGSWPGLCRPSMGKSIHSTQPCTGRGLEELPGGGE